MPLYMVERRFADALEMTVEESDRIGAIHGEEGVEWLNSFLSADRRSSYCLYEAPSVEAIHAASRRAGIPVDAVVEVEKWSPRTA